MNVKGFNSADMGRRIKELRKQRGLRQEDVSTATGIKRETLSTIESGIRALKDQEIVQIAEILGTSCDYLLTGVSAKNTDIHKNTGLTEAAINSLCQLIAMENRKANTRIGGNEWQGITAPSTIIDLLNHLLASEEGLFLLRDMALFVFTDFNSARAILPEGEEIVEVSRTAEGKGIIKTEEIDGTKMIKTHKVTELKIDDLVFSGICEGQGVKLSQRDIEYGAQYKIMRMLSAVKHVWEEEYQNEQTSQR